jgi:hypothetical protein
LGVALLAMFGSIRGIELMLGIRDPMLRFGERMMLCA